MIPKLNKNLGMDIIQVMFHRQQQDSGSQPVGRDPVATLCPQKYLHYNS